MTSRNNTKIIIPMVLYSTGMIFYTMLPSGLTMGLSFLMVTYFYNMLRRENDYVDSIILLSIIMIPTSTISVIGTNYGSLPLTWYNVSVIVAVCLIGIKGKLNRNYFIMIALFGIVELFRSMFLPNLGNALKQLLTIVLLLFAFLIGSFIKNYSNLTIKESLLNYYFYGTVSVALQVIVQRAYIMATGHIIGHYGSMGSGRFAYAGLFGDYSFANLYLATGALLVFLEYINRKKTSFIKFTLYESLMLVSMLMISARTGIFSLVITAVIYTIFNIKKFNYRLGIVVIASCIIGPNLIGKLVSVRGGQTLLDSSGRLEMYDAAVKYFINKPFIGYGLGLENLNKITGLGAIHNFILQYLVQMGIIGTVLLLMPFAYFLMNTMKRISSYSWLFVLVAIGALFIPDIVSSRFLYGIILICMLCSEKQNNGMGELYET